MRSLWLLLGFLLAWPALAEESPRVIVESRLVPNQQISVGGTVALEIDLLVETWFTAAPQLPALQLPGAVVTPPNGEALHLSEQRDGTPFFGLRITYRITPQQAGEFDIPALDIQVQPGQAAGPRNVQSQAQHFSAAQPSGLAEGEQALVAQQLTFTQQLSYSHDPLRVGDSVTRQLSIRAEGAQAMLIPAPELVEVDGLKRYLKTPQVGPMGDSRGNFSGGQRDDSVTYVVNESGDFSLPAIELKWWDSGGQAHTASVPEVTFEATGDSSYQAPFSLAEDLRRLGHRGQLHIARHWLPISVALAALVLALFFGRSWLQRALHWLRRQREARRQAWLASPAYAWQQAQQQLSATPARLDALYLWVRRSGGGSSLQQFGTQLPKPLAQRLLALIGTRYAKPTTTSASTDELRHALGEARQAFETGRTDQVRPQALHPLNPRHRDS